MPKNIIRLIGEGFSSYFKNLVVVLPFLFQIILVAITGTLAMFLFAKTLNLQLFDLVLQKLTAEQLQEVFISAFSASETISKLVFLFVLSFLIVLLISSYFIPGAIGMMLSVFKSNKKPSLKEMNEYGKRFFWRYFFLQLIINVFFFVLASIIFLPVLLSNSSAWAIVLFIILFIALIIFYIFFILAPFVLIVKDSFVFQSIKQSFILTKKNFWALINLGALYFVMSAIVQIIPYVGSILSALIINPALNLSIVLFCIERS
jgi:hypothetical protein